MSALEPITPSSEEQPQPPVRGYYIPQSKPVASRIVLGVLLVVFVIQVLYGWVRYGALMGFNGGDIRVLVELGAKYDPAIYQGEYWRLFTATLLHGGVLHLMFNLYALFSLGPLLESYLGPARFLAIYVLGGLFGSLLSYAFTDSVSVGASGAIFGIFGATIVYFFRYRHAFGANGRAILQNMLFILVVNLLFGFVGSARIDNWGHIGGLLGGAIVAIGLVPKYEAPAAPAYGVQPLQEVDRRHWEIAWVIGCTVVFVIGVWLANLWYARTI